MHIGYKCDREESGTKYGAGFPIIFCFTLQFDRLAFWRKVPHKHIPERYSTSWFPEAIVNQRCDKCLRWYVIATGKLHHELNKRENI